MNRELANILRDILLTLPWVDKAVGLVKTVERHRKDEKGNITTQKIPASVETTQELLNKGEYTSLVPDSIKHKNVFYFEDAPVRNITRPTRGLSFETTLRLVCWMNTDHDEYAKSKAINEILAAIPLHPVGNDNIYTIQVIPDTILSPEDNIFGKYNYDEKIRQYLMQPYTAFAIDFRCRYTVGLNCIPISEPESPLVWQTSENEIFMLTENDKW